MWYVGVGHLWYAILLATIVLAYWAVRELTLNTFNADFAKKKPFIIGFALVGLTIAMVFVAGARLVSRSNQAYSWLWAVLMLLCPPSLLQVVFIDIPRPPLSWVIAVGLLTAMMNSGLYAAIGGRVGALKRKSN
jgi:hypothetical protein